MGDASKSSAERHVKNRSNTNVQTQRRSEDLHQWVIKVKDCVTWEFFAM